jgi:hypothetical protein
MKRKELTEGEEIKEMMIREENGRDKRRRVNRGKR